MLLVLGLCGSARADHGLFDANGDGHPIFRNVEVAKAEDLYHASSIRTWGIAFGDFDGDGIVDLATANRFTVELAVLSVLVTFGTGDGGFGQSGPNTQYDIDIPSGHQAITLAVAAADLDGDGDVDLAVLGTGALSSNPDPNFVAILLNDGDGTFAVQPVVYTVGRSATDLAIGDLDADGDSDLVVTARNCTGGGPYSFEENVFVLLNNGDATFAPAVPYMADPGHPGALSVAIGDLDADGHLDLAVGRHDCVGAGGRPGFTVFINNGDGTFAAPLVSLHAGGNSVALGDLDDDGDLDLGLTWPDFFADFGLVYVFLNPGNGVFPAADGSYTTGPEPAGVAFADLNGDGHLDVAVVNTRDWRVACPPAPLSDVSVLLGNGDGTLADEVRFGAGNWPWDLAVADVDNDGDMDLGVANLWSANVSILLNDGAGGFAETVLDVGQQNPETVAIGDLDGDGDPDLVVANMLNSGSVSVFLNQGDRVFADPVTYPGGSGTDVVGIWTPKWVTLADLNGDDDLDIAVVNWDTESIDVLFNQGDGTFDPLVAFDTGSWKPVFVAAVDLNGDDAKDLAVANFWGGVTILLNDGSGGFGPPSTNYLPSLVAKPLRLAPADFDGDGDVDLAVTHYWTADANRATLTLLHNNGDGTFGLDPFDGDILYDGSAHGGPLEFLADSPVAADLDNDGDIDLAVSTYSISPTDEGTDVFVLLNNGDGTFAAPLFYDRQSWEHTRSVMSAGDLDGDGDLDLAVANWIGKNITVLLNDGDGAFDSFEYGGGQPVGLAIGDLNGDGGADIAIANSGGSQHWERSHNTVSILWNQDCGLPHRSGDVFGDLDGDGEVGAFDLALLLGSWGGCE